MPFGDRLGSCAQVSCSWATAAAAATTSIKHSYDWDKGEGSEQEAYELHHLLRWYGQHVTYLQLDVKDGAGEVWEQLHDLPCCSELVEINFSALYGNWGHLKCCTKLERAVLSHCQVLVLDVLPKVGALTK